MTLTADRLRELLDYDKATGVFTWRQREAKTGRDRRWNLLYAGTQAGSSHSDGYIKIQIDKRPYFAHRLAWLHVHGVWPEQEIDHINRQRSDNRLANLRPATPAQNRSNASVSNVGISGTKGVHWSGSKWRATIVVKGKRIHLGTFEDIEAAKTTRIAAARQHFGEFA